jgi:hypothetical protein
LKNLELLITLLVQLLHLLLFKATEVNKIAKADLIDVLNFASAVNLPTTGIAGKIYVTNDDNKIYRWNGTIYQPLSGSGSESKHSLHAKNICSFNECCSHLANLTFCKHNRRF